MHAKRHAVDCWLPPLIEVRSFSCDVYSVCLFHDIDMNNFKLTISHPAYFCGADLLVDVIPYGQRGYAKSQHDCWVRNLQENSPPHIMVIAAIKAEVDGSFQRLMIKVSKEEGVYCG